MGEQTSEPAVYQPPSGGPRHPYKILRGSISRREGDVQRARDNETGQPTKRKVRPFVHYTAKTNRDPQARDEIMLTEREFEALGGKTKLRRLVQGNVVTETEDSVSSAEEPSARPVELSPDRAVRITQLIDEGQTIRGPGELKKWRERVLQAGVLTGEVPSRRQDLLDALHQAG